jgi:hypothetical protein
MADGVYGTTALRREARTRRRAVQHAVNAASSRARKLPIMSPECTPGSGAWFQAREGLNGYGHIPSSGMRDAQATKEEVQARFGLRSKRGEWLYTSRNESPRMRHTIRYLYQRVFQRTISEKGYFPYGFARGIMAERHGWAVNWVAYAHKMSAYGSRPFECIEERQQRIAEHGGSTPPHAVAPDWSGKEASANDWEVNVIVAPPTSAEMEDRKCTLRPQHPRPHRRSGGPTPTTATAGGKFALLPSSEYELPVFPSRQIYGIVCMYSTVVQESNKSGVTKTCLCSLSLTTPSSEGNLRNREDLNLRRLCLPQADKESALAGEVGMLWRQRQFRPQRRRPSRRPRGILRGASASDSDQRQRRGHREERKRRRVLRGTTGHLVEDYGATGHLVEVGRQVRRRCSSSLHMTTGGHRPPNPERFPLYGARGGAPEPRLPPNHVNSKTVQERCMPCLQGRLEVIEEEPWPRREPESRLCCRSIEHGTSVRSCQGAADARTASSMQRS